jgi:hypothetical protein
MDRKSGFVAPLCVGAESLLVLPGVRRASVCDARPAVRMSASGEEGKGLFGRLRDAILKPIVAVPGSGAEGSLVKCPFCQTGTQDCDGCKGSGKDAMGVCLMCSGKGQLKCAVCEGVGMVDRVRRGGTDDRNQYLGKGKLRNPPLRTEK